ncbi:MAG: riboflavin synthase [Chloroflexi bacterium]|nr:riboflavin synthase [Chloroflexota bacterium]
MFTGIVEEVGKVLNITDDTLAFSASKTIEDAIVGSSICVNGVCLTLISLDKNSGTVNIGPETKKLSNIGELTLNNLVNLERPLSPQDRFGGHIVQGHIEGTCTIVNIIKNDISYEIDLKSQEYLNRYIVKKCFITLDGISLTVNEIINNTFRVSIIPHTWENTNLQNRKIGDRINVETDIIARYIERILEK